MIVDDAARRTSFNAPVRNGTFRSREVTKGILQQSPPCGSSIASISGIAKPGLKYLYDFVQTDESSSHALCKVILFRYTDPSQEHHTHLAYVQGQLRFAKNGHIFIQKLMSGLRANHLALPCDVAVPSSISIEVLVMDGQRLGFTTSMSIENAYPSIACLSCLRIGAVVRWQHANMEKTIGCSLERRILDDEQTRVETDGYHINVAGLPSTQLVTLPTDNVCLVFHLSADSLTFRPPVEAGPGGEGDPTSGGGGQGGGQGGGGGSKN